MTALRSPTPLDRADSKLNYTVRLMEQLVVATFVVDADCRVVIWNRACERLTGLQAGEVIGTRDQWRAFYLEPRPKRLHYSARRPHRAAGIYACGTGAI